MSYCRTSEESDLYAYHSISGNYELMVACNRVPDNIIDANHNNIVEIIESEKYKIGLPYDGETYKFNTLQELKDKMLELKEIGYKVPDEAFELIDRELGDK